jgi:uncharacterized UPF0160 family protein
MLIATHNGSFHADEITASVIFLLLDANTQFIRSRDPSVLEKADYVIDVSGKFDLDKHFDHHPKEFTLSRSNGIKYATAGLIWKYFGKQLLLKIAENKEDLKQLDEKIINNAWATIDRKLMQYTDLTDNGQLDSYTEELCGLHHEDNKIYNTLNQFYMQIPVIPYLVAMQNVPEGTDEEQFSAFMNTVKAISVLYKNVFENTLKNARDEQKVIESYDGSEILRLDNKLPWFESVLNNWDIFTNCKLAMYPDHNKTGYRLQSLPGSLASRFVNRCSAPKSWRGKEFEELNKLVGIKTATFVHKAGFTGGAITKEDIELMAKEWIAHSED